MWIPKSLRTSANTSLFMNIPDNSSPIITSSIPISVPPQPTIPTNQTTSNTTSTPTTTNIPTNDTDDDIDLLVNEIVNGEKVNEYFFNCAGLISDLGYVMQIIEKKKNANMVDLMKRNILHHACRWGNLGIVKYGISKGVSVNLKDSLGNTPLHYCCEEGYTAIVTVLLHHPNIKATLKNKEGMTPKKKAQYSGYSDVVTLLERYLGNIYLFKENLKNQVIDVEDTYSNYKLSDISIRTQYD